MYNIYNFKQTRTHQTVKQRNKMKKRERKNTPFIPRTSISMLVFHESRFHITLRLDPLTVSFFSGPYSTFNVCYWLMVLWNLIASNRFIIPTHRMLTLLYSLSCGVCVCVRFFLQLFVHSFVHSFGFILFFYNA